jgi:hypothetical protein
MGLTIGGIPITIIGIGMDTEAIAETLEQQAQAQGFTTGTTEEEGE